MIDDQSKAKLLNDDNVKMAVPKRKLMKLLKICSGISIVTTFLLVITALTTGRRISDFIKFIQVDVVQSSLTSGYMENIVLSRDSQTLTFTDKDLNQNYMTINFSHKLINTDYKPPSPCRDTFSKDEPEYHDIYLRESLSKAPQMCFQFEYDIKAAVYEMNLDDISCHAIHWYSSNSSAEISNCIDIENDFWYGGGGLSIQRWPINRVNVPLQVYLTRKFKQQSEDDFAVFDSFIEPYFISAQGVALQFEPYLPLFVSLNHKKNHKMCFTSAFQKPFSYKNASNFVLLKYMICKDRDARAIHRQLLKTTKVFHPHDAPSKDILQTPIWSTRGISVVEIDERKLLNFTNEIKSNKLPYNQLYVDGNYSKSEGSIYFNEQKFPHSHQLIMELASDPGAATMLVGTEVYPYISKPEPDRSKVPYNMSSVEYSSHPSYLDVTKEDMVANFKSQLKETSESINLKGFRFSGGSAFELVNGPSQPSSVDTIKNLDHPNMFTTQYADIASNFSSRSLLGSGYRSQQYAFVTDAGPLQQSWEHNKGLKSIIPMVLTYGILGYPFVLAGPIGGKSDSIDSKTGFLQAPDKELFIRWLQLATYLPVMEFSTGPWVYGQDVVNYTLAMLKFRHDVLWPKYFSAAVQEAIVLGTPVARPLWWIAPEDKTAQFIDCEFFLSNSVLVAPVLTPKSNYRDIYLPEGSWWKDELRGITYKGGQWLHKFNVKLYEIATFVRISSPQSADIKKNL